MDKDFYKTLGISRTANDDEIKKAYKKLALRYHPDKNKDTNAEDKFKEISEAYEVLSDKNRRQNFDRFGVDGLKNGLGDHANGGSWSRTANNPYDRTDPYRTFNTFFNASNGHRYNFPEGPNINGVDDGYFRPYKAYHNLTRQSSAKSNHRQTNLTPPLTKQQDAPVEHDLPVTLEEVLRGTTKKMKINRKALHPDGRSYREEKVLTIEVKPGWKAGTKITFPKEGDQSANSIAADIVFIIRDKPHPIFTRDGSDLHYKHKITLKQALIHNVEVRTPTLTGETICLPVTGVIKPTTSIKIPNRGLPHTKDPKKLGDLVVGFDIQFPDSISEESRELISKALP